MFSFTVLQLAAKLKDGDDVMQFFSFIFGIIRRNQMEKQRHDQDILSAVTFGFSSDLEAAVCLLSHLQ